MEETQIEEQQVEQTEQQEQSGTVLANAQTESAAEGAPESYDFTGSIPEGATLDEKEAADFGNLCRELNLTNEQANKLAAYGFGYAQRGFDAYNEQRNAEIDGWADEAKKDLGTEYDSTVHLAAVGDRCVVDGLHVAVDAAGHLSDARRAAYDRKSRYRYDHYLVHAHGNDVLLRVRHIRCDLLPFACVRCRIRYILVLLLMSQKPPLTLTLSSSAVRRRDARLCR